MAQPIDVICIGAAIVDIPLQPVSKNIFDVDSYPLERIAMTTGGDAINEATILSRLGHKTALNSRIGDDAPGHFILAACRRENIDIQSLMLDTHIDTSINVGLVTEDGERTFVTNCNGSLWKLNIDDVDFSRFPEAKLLSLASIFNSPLLEGQSLVKIFQQAKAHHLTLCADMIKPRLGERLEDIQDALSYVDYLFPNYDEARLLTGESSLDSIADRFLACGVKNVVIKHGKNGCFIKTRTESLSVPAVKGITAIDTIGAGDNFVSGFISGVLEGKTLLECARFANATAAISVLSVGATTGVKNRKLVEQLLEEYEG
ncbi:carbohydrate kinase family protein [Candidatus Symbiopectobacterium sp. NZEC151]|uniref:carbohydrate kinase family protein n=2 Tax=unclassified Symbiopectobacterium TaxID=2794573 RepID=UPI0022274B2A|nr:sugar kinase [Candidatus Symbiopectobacterium sp. NZEC151]MCW2477285.1 carbohydrate kinase family protein [Candidatus Symbiopectobacterium sp. NZEC151]